MALRFAKVVAHARPPEKLNVNDPGITLFSAENFKVEYSEVHAYRTGVVIEIPEGSIGLLMETNNMGVQGVTVAGGLLTPNNVGEVRVSLVNSHRNAMEIKSGDPLCFLLLLSAPDSGKAEEYDLEGLTNEMKATFQEAREASIKEADKK